MVFTKNNIYRFIYRNRKILLSITIFIFLFCVLGLPYKNWGFFVDDGGLIWSSRLLNLKKFFTGISANELLHSSNYVHQKQNFFSVYYRPLTFIFYYLQKCLFGFSAYGYFLVNIFFHAINTVLLFNIFLYFSGYTISFLMAMMFAFHPSLCCWLGWVASQVYQLELFFIFMLIMFLKKYLDTNKKVFYIVSLLFYLFSLFTRELSIVLPFWLLIALFFYFDYKNKEFSFLDKIIYSFKFSFGYWFLFLFYFFLRLFLYPIDWHASSNFSLLNFKFLNNRWPDFLTFITNLANQDLFFLPGGNRVLKGFLVLIFFIPICWLFYKNEKKKYIIFWFVSISLFLWPAILHLYVNRYLYPVIPFYLFAILFLFEFFKKNSNFIDLKIKKLISVFLFLLIPFNFYILTKALKYQEKALHKRELIFKSLIDNETLKNRPICFFCLPGSLFYNSIAQHLWIRGFNKNLHIYYDDRTFISNDFSKKQKNPNIMKTCNGFRFIICEENDQSFIVYRSNKMGLLSVNKLQEGKVVDVSLKLEDKYFQQNISFITWDYQKNEFKYLDEELL